MSKNSSEPILLDSDVVRHFLNGNQLDKLALIYPRRLVLLDKVKKELCLSKSLVNPVNDFITNHNIIELAFPADQTIIMEYAYLRRDFGEGESACMAVAKYQKQFIASSNLKDIKAFCVKNNITYLTTVDILWNAYEIKVMSESECEAFLKDVLASGSKLPFSNFSALKDAKA
ncbi:MAG: hypothetical protein EOP48_28740 [Sphingobacteriales bacterium]|nr:MAG: hypothetical protein EOP48_28740 [Sphingobacteriales bacterium]